MTVTGKTYINFFTASVMLMLVEVIIYFVASHFGIRWFMFIFAPLAFLAAAIYWLHSVTSTKCPHCNNLYGVGIGMGGWPTIPETCLNCGEK